MTSSEQAGPWLFIGAGNMGRAIAAGAAGAGAVGAGDLAAVDPGAAGPGPFGFLGRSVDEGAGWLAERPGAGVMLAVKPQSFAEVARAWRAVLDAGPGRPVVSILAGMTAGAVAAGLGPRARVVRVMPNTPIRVGMGMSAVCPGPGAGPDDLRRVERLFGASGETVRLDESLMDAFTALAGSGPAYVFYLAEAMAGAAESLGFDRERALAVVRQTVAGAGALLGATDEPPDALRAAVTSKGGTTAAATDALDAAGVREAVVRAVRAARDRGAELGRAGG